MAAQDHYCKDKSSRKSSDEPIDKSMHKKWQKSHSSLKLKIFSWGNFTLFDLQINKLEALVTALKKMQIALLQNAIHSLPEALVGVFGAIRSLSKNRGTASELTESLDDLADYEESDDEEPDDKDIENVS